MDERAEDAFGALRAALGSSDQRRWRLPSGVPTAAGLVLLVAAALLGFSALRPADSSPSTAAPEPIDPTVTTTGDEHVTEREPAMQVWPQTPFEVVGNEVRSGDQRWTIGAEGDLVAIGDWDCDGSRTPAVLRPSSGALFLFDGWSAPGEERVARAGPVAASGAVGFEARGCGQGAVRMSDGSEQLVSTTDGGD